MLLIFMQLIFYMLKIQVFLVLCQLPKLTFLNLSCNPLDAEFDKEKIEAIVQNNGCLPKLKNLVLNNTRIPFEVVFKILNIFNRYVI